MKKEAGMDKPYDLKERTKTFALQIIRLYSSLPKDGVSQVIGKQLLRSGTSVGANYREATRSRSTAELISKIEISLQELEESTYWMELFVDSGIVNINQMQMLIDESVELNAILTRSIITLKSKS